MRISPQGPSLGLSPFRRLAGGGGGDPYFANVSSLLLFSGPNGSTTIVDEIPGNSWTAFNGAQLDTSTSPFGGSSLYLDGTNNFIRSAASSNFGLGSGDWTIEVFYNEFAGGGNNTLFDNRSASDQGVACYPSASSVGGQFAYANNSSVLGGGYDIPSGVWGHLVLCKQGTNVRGYWNGVQRFVVSDGRTLASSAIMTIGDNYAAPSQPLSGWLGGFRITKGICRYPDGTTFTPPAEQFPTS
jgi:Concanavalin A-like lectin/glucanases superfamily